MPAVAVTPTPILRSPKLHSGCTGEPPTIAFQDARNAVDAVRPCNLMTREDRRGKVHYFQAYQLYERMYPKFQPRKVPLAC
ncbi:Hypothetical protein NTJ_11877 [Nesidiocoris tenuis]|uniref:Uncharacterized protein n=1 Tax=Nesidiocoris tenuis TaxID=355587 RepID=A0ABN7B7D2_9HEMI|nr:Hypothetical protein NTJ_11877 [Nesidiocoris tenuis]